MSSTATAGLLVLAFALNSAIGFLPTASATTTVTLNSTTCGSTLGGTWAGTSCTLSTSYTIPADTELEVPSGTTLVIAGPSGSIVNDGTLQVDIGGIVTVTGAPSLYGIENYGTITNSGVINLENTGYYSIWNPGGTITNAGTINITTSGAFGVEGIYSVFYNGVSPVITDSGTINIQNTGSTYGIQQGIAGTLTVTPTGVISITQSGELGLYSIGTTIDDEGQIIVYNTGAYGIDNNGPMTVSGTLTVGPGADAVLNQATITQACGGVINGPGTIAGNPYTPATGCTAVPQFPSTGFGPLLLGLLVPALLVFARRARMTGSGPV